MSICLNVKRKIGIADITTTKILINARNVWKKIYLNILSLVRIADILGMAVINEVKIKEKCVLAKNLSGVSITCQN